MNNILLGICICLCIVILVVIVVCIKCNDFSQTEHFTSKDTLNSDLSMLHSLAGGIPGIYLSRLSKILEKYITCEDIHAIQKQVVEDLQIPWSISGGSQLLKISEIENIANTKLPCFNSNDSADEIIQKIKSVSNPMDFEHIGLGDDKLILYLSYVNKNVNDCEKLAKINKYLSETYDNPTVKFWHPHLYQMISILKKKIKGLC